MMQSLLELCADTIGKHTWELTFLKLQLPVDIYNDLIHMWCWRFMEICTEYMDVVLKDEYIYSELREKVQRYMLHMYSLNVIETKPNYICGLGSLGPVSVGWTRMRSTREPEDFVLHTWPKIQIY